MTETHDLATRLLAAIEETEAYALALTRGGRTGEWTALTTPRGDFRVLDELGYSVIEHTDVNSDPWFTTVHVALNDPAATLRRCAADRKIVEIHKPVRVPPTWATYGVTRHLESTGGLFCKTCCDDDDGTSYAQRVGLEWPCDTIRALAEGYGLAERGDQP